MLNIALCDDNPNRTRMIRDMLDDILSSKGMQYQLDCISDGTELMALLADDATRVSVVFLDLGTASGNNRALAAEIIERYPQITIFDSSHLDSQGSDKLHDEFVRPMAAYVLENVLNHTLRETDHDLNRVLTVRAKGAVYNFLIDDIEYVMSDRRLVIIRENGNDSTVYAKLDDIEQRVGSGFVRCHQSYLVNMACIKTFDNKKITLFSGAVIPISQKRRIQSREQYYRFLGNSIIYKKPVAVSRHS